MKQVHTVTLLRAEWAFVTLSNQFTFDMDIMKQAVKEYGYIR